MNFPWRKRPCWDASLRICLRSRLAWQSHRVPTATKSISAANVGSSTTSASTAGTTTTAFSGNSSAASGASAEFGRTAGGVINVITKSGTNDLHGSLFEYFRSEGLTANTSDGKPLKDFRRNQFGGTVGGPIVRDKMF